MNITLKQLTYFKALAEQGNFRRAAEQCHVSQPALSVQIQELERSLGGALVERQTRGLLLTPLGREVLETAQRVLSDIAQLERSAHNRLGLGGALRLGVIPTIAPYLLPEALAALRSADISLDVQITEGKTDRILDLLAEGALDACILALPSERDGLEERALFEDRFLLAGSAGRLESLGPDINPEGLGDSQLLLLEDGHCLTDQALAACGRGRGHARIHMGASSLPTLTRLVEAGFGLTLMPELAAATERAVAPGMGLRRFDGVQPSRRVGLVRRATRQPAPWFDALADTLAQVGSGLVNDARLLCDALAGATAGRNPLPQKEKGAGGTG
ncbi:hydrogen peroxide-inducible genes activator [Tropicibacter oceani]|uniref:Hydrogen peroxide-inducible genes activator n=1 Tax=Tropicibacter oceani TaxID=3058420 RepID=A0ABY8QH49_9RHOB|nr:hydrogen peroxide-inducible genes activator [Tropicibacter oceani]WGW03132.1 hydrogen peroxide-inducible genes activator [Tropicibacter oceani]